MDQIVTTINYAATSGMFLIVSTLCLWLLLMAIREAPCGYGARLAVAFRRK